jgi:outer membrane lipoprotein-sorting protein
MPIQSKITEHNNDSMTVLLFDLQKNVNIAGSEFSINAPKNVKIIPA